MKSLKLKGTKLTPSLNFFQFGTILNYVKTNHNFDWKQRDSNLVPDTIPH